MPHFALIYDLKILNDKLTSLQVTTLNLSDSHGFTGNLSVLFTYGLPKLTTLILRSRDLNSDDLQRLAKAEAEGKLPQLEHLDTSGYGYNNVQIDNLFTHSAQWNQLTTITTSDENILNVAPEFLTSLEELILYRHGRVDRSITREWLRLKAIRVDVDVDLIGKNLPRSIIHCIVDGVERGMFPSLKTVRSYRRVPIPIQLKLFRANRSISFECY